MLQSGGNGWLGVACSEDPVVRVEVLKSFEWNQGRRIKIVGSNDRFVQIMTIQTGEVLTASLWS